MNQDRINIPNILTISRILLIPVLVACFYTDSPIAPWICVSIFFFACITDYLDGYIARVYDQMTRFGQVMDPIADKLLIGSTLLLMAGFGKMSPLAIIPSIIILCREMVISGFREFLGELRVNLPVSRLAKIKTAIQMLAIGLLLVCDLFSKRTFLEDIGELLLWIASFLSIYTGYAYYRETLKYI